MKSFTNMLKEELQDLFKWSNALYAEMLIAWKVR